MLTNLIGITPKLTNPKASLYIASTLRTVAEVAGGRVYMVGVLSHSPPAGFAVTSLLNISEFARQVGGVKAVVIVLPWNITAWLKSSGNLTTVPARVSATNSMNKVSDLVVGGRKF
ncbi:hypothetical protein [Pyrobaculum ferrireducens]|uniref:hypothetical protein n=1 Tax=Pyrobaculum ferrireducens TaxID=1104324 RepID=UPI000AFB3F47|nr:hypothetical protein [Pyrobaculum ferrireducens]